MKKYIEREAVIQFIKKEGYDECYDLGTTQDNRYFCEEINRIPAADVVEIVRCKDCKHRPTKPKKYSDGFDLEFPEDEVCPCYCGDDPFYSWYPSDDWFCPKGERKGETE